MAQNTKPVFSLTPETRLGVITTATTDKSGATTTNIIDLLTASTDGTKVTQIKFKHVGSSTAGLCLVWVTDDAGANPRLLSEAVYGVVTSDVTVPTAEATIFYPDLQLKAGQKILVGATTATTNIHVTAQIGNF